MNNYTAPNIKEQILFVTNSIVNKMDNVDKIKSSRKTADYPQNKFIVKISQLKKKHKSASVYFLGDAIVKHIAPTTWQPNGYTWTHHPKSVTNIYFNEDKKEYVFSWGSGGEIEEEQFYSLFRVASSVKDLLEKI
tara:strand:+ start:261 stop:665 length:405 start_codon:yes stop_codon:yes gene_type:complete